MVVDADAAVTAVAGVVETGTAVAVVEAAAAGKEASECAVLLKREAGRSGRSVQLCLGLFAPNRMVACRVMPQWKAQPHHAQAANSLKLPGAPM